jgi:uncharacterized protein YeaO (DUF488 family)
MRGCGRLIRATKPELAEGDAGRGRTLTILYAARDREHSNAAVLAPIVCRGLPRNS